MNPLLALFTNVRKLVGHSQVAEVAVVSPLDGMNDKARLDWPIETLGNNDKKGSEQRQARTLNSSSAMTLAAPTVQE